MTPAFRLPFLLSALLLGAAQAAPLALTATPEARAVRPFSAVVPTPRQATYPAGALPLTGLGVKTVGAAPELTWAVRDLRDEWKVRLGAPLPDGGGKTVTIGTRADADLAARARAAGLYTEVPEGYALWVDAGGAFVVGADAKGAYYGAQTLRQLLTPEGLRFARIQDAPALNRRMAMLYLDAASKPVNDRLIPLLAALKYNSVLVMSNYVQWDVAKAGGWAHPGGATKAEAKRVADLARSYGMDVVPLLETPGHATWMFNNGKNLDLAQDPDVPAPYAYDTLNPASYERVILPTLKEIVETFTPRTVHIGRDEARADGRGRFPGRPNGVAVGFEKLFTDDTLKLHAFLKERGVGTMIWHDVAFADSLIGSVPPKLPKDIQVGFWNYTGDANPDLMRRIRALGFPVLGASWWKAGNAEGMAKAAVQAGADGMIQTRWSGYFGNTSVWDGMAEQGVALVRAGAAFWNPDAPPVGNDVQVYRSLYQPQAYARAAGQLVDLSPAVTRALKDDSGSGWIQKGASTDLRNLPAGKDVALGDYRFNVSGAVMLRGSRPAARELPEQVSLDLGGKKADALALLLTTGWAGANNREVIGKLDVKYTDGSLLSVPLEYGRHLRSWTEVAGTTENLSMIPAPGWAGKTGDGLDVNVLVLDWTNPKPGVAIQALTLSSAGRGANPTLLGLTLIGGR